MNGSLSFYECRCGEDSGVVGTFIPKQKQSNSFELFCTQRWLGC